MVVRLLEIADSLRHYGRKRHMSQEQALGRRAEDIAQRFLQRAGIIVVARNYRTSGGSGEIDLVGWEHDKLVFVEVKSRQTSEYGLPERAIGPDKKARILRAARDFARHSEVPWENVRFDVVSVVFSAPPVVNHYRDVFRDPFQYTR